MIGAALFIFGYQFGLYIAAIAIVTNTCYMITAAWLLVIGAFDQKTASLLFGRFRELNTHRVPLIVTPLGMAHQVLR
jgi:hypothetical protein